MDWKDTWEYRYWTDQEQEDRYVSIMREWSKYEEKINNKQIPTENISDEEIDQEYQRFLESSGEVVE